MTKNICRYLFRNDMDAFSDNSYLSLTMDLVKKNFQFHGIICKVLNVVIIQTTNLQSFQKALFGQTGPQSLMCGAGPAHNDLLTERTV
jgi:hypothetical protein